MSVKSKTVVRSVIPIKLI